MSNVTSLPESQPEPQSGGAEGAARDTVQEPADTKERLLDAAERLIAERGFEGTSMRAVTHAARCAVSAANYHFGTKQALLAAVMRRRMEPLNRQRIEAIDRVEAVGPATLEALFEAYFRPRFDRLAQAGQQGDGSFPRQVAARLYSDPPELVQALKSEVFGEVTARFNEALVRSLPGVPTRAVEMVQQLAIASMVHVISGQLDAELTRELEASAESDDASHEPLLRMLVIHSAAGARAIAAAAREEGK